MQQTTIKLKLLKQNNGQIEGLPKNPRTISKEKFDSLVKSIQDDPEMLELRELLVFPFNESFIVIAGNMRLKAMQHLKHKEAPCKILDPATPIEKLKAYTIKDNISYGSNDWDALKEWDQEELTEWGLDIPDYESPIKEAHEDHYVIPDEIITDIKCGDLFQIGPHRILCGDSTSPEDVVRLMDGKKAQLIYTDPPYGVSFTGVKNDRAHLWEMIENDELKGDALFDFLVKAFKNAKENSDPDIAAYIWYASCNHIIFEKAVLAAGWEVKQQIIWNKGMVMGRSDYHWAHEPMLYCKKEKQTTKWYGDRTQKTILGARITDLINMKKEELVKVIKLLIDNSTNWEIDKDNCNSYKHPNQKPVALAGRAINNSTKEGDIILDLFHGSGSTGVAAHQLGRIIYAMEYEPKYVQIEVDRMAALDSRLTITKNGMLYEPPKQPEP